MNIIFHVTTTTARAGADLIDQQMCGIKTIQLDGNISGSGSESGLWSIKTGLGTNAYFSDSLNAKTLFTGTPGIKYELLWTITNTSCPASSDTVKVNFLENPSTADAGPDQLTLCGNGAATLSAAAPSVGIGIWTVTGANGVVADPLNRASTFTGDAGVSYVLTWTVTKDAVCAPVSDDVSIKFNQAPSAANAGPDQTGSSMCGKTNTQLSGNTPLSGSGTWSILSGSGGNIPAPGISSFTFTGKVGEAYSLKWEITNSSCPPASDIVQVSFEKNPTESNAGTNQEVCINSTDLQSNLPQSGTGQWSVVSGTGTLANNTLTNTSVNNLSAGQNVFRWTISSGNSCESSISDVTITYTRGIVELGKDTLICEGTKIILAPAGYKEYVWHDGTTLPYYLVSAPGHFSVTATDDRNCKSFGDITVGECDTILIPNVFTPNKDLVNDAFVIRGNKKNSELTIYNRWGTQIFHVADYMNNWDGDNNSEGIYYYIYARPNENKRIGWLEIIR